MARANPFLKIEEWMERIVERPFAFIFPAKLAPVEIERRLKRAMESHLLLVGGGRNIAPNAYDVYLSIKDHQEIATGQSYLIAEWQNHLIVYARQRHYTLKTDPIIRLHASSDLRMGNLRVEAELVDSQHMGGSNGSGGMMATQALTPEQLEQLRQQLPSAPQAHPRNMAGQAQGGALPLSPIMQGGAPPLSPIMQGGTPQMGQVSGAGNMAMPRGGIPAARLTIQLPQAGQQVYHIDKPVVNIGRQLTNDIIVEDKRVSRHHAQIKYQMSDGTFVIYDLSSTNGITINGNPHVRQHTLNTGDQFTIGSYDFHFERK